MASTVQVTPSFVTVVLSTKSKIVVLDSKTKNPAAQDHFLHVGAILTRFGHAVRKLADQFYLIKSRLQCQQKSSSLSRPPVVPETIRFPADGCHSGLIPRGTPGSRPTRLERPPDDG